MAQTAPWTSMRKQHQSTLSRDFSEDGPLGWLRWIGCDPNCESSFRKPITSKRPNNEYVLSNAMFEACAMGEISVAKYLYVHGASEDIHSRDNQGCSTLLTACREGHLQIAQWLYDVGCKDDIEARDNLGKTPMFVACQEGRLEIAQWLFQVGVEPYVTYDIARTTDADQSCTPMFISCWQGHLHICQWLYDVGAAADVRTPDIDGDTPMYVACQYGHTHVAKWLTRVGAAADLSSRNQKGLHSPLWGACYYGHMETVLWLLLQGAANRPRTESGTPSSAALEPAGAVQEGRDQTSSAHAGSTDSEDEQVSIEQVRQEVGDRWWPTLLDSLAQLEQDRTTFINTVLAAVVCATGVAVEDLGSASSESSSDVGGQVHQLCSTALQRTGQRQVESSLEKGQSATEGVSETVDTREVGAGRGSSCLLPMLRGHEATIVRLVADFVGIPHGRQLRNAREAYACLALAEKSRVLEAAEEELGARQREEREALEAVDEAKRHLEAMLLAAQGAKARSTEAEVQRAEAERALSSTLTFRRPPFESARSADEDASAPNGR